MICKNCGATLPDGTRFCTSCGARTFDEPVANQGFNTPRQYEYPQGFNQQVPAKKGFSQLLQEKPMLKIILPIVAVLVVAGLIVGGIFLFKDSSGGGGSGGEGGSGGASSYKQVVSTFFEAIEKEDGKKLENLMPDFALEVASRSGASAADINEAFQSMVSEMHDECAYAVDSDNFKISYKIVNEEKMDKDDLKERVLESFDVDEDDLEDAGIKLGKFEEGIELEVEFTIEGDDDNEDTDTFYFELVKIDGKWSFASFDF